MFCLLLVSLLAGGAVAGPADPRGDLPEGLEIDPMWAVPLNTTADGLPLFEGDIVLTDEQRADRKGLPSNYLWPGGNVPYVITASSAADRSVITLAVRHWRALTCLNLREVPTNYASGPHLRFIKSGGCWSYIGRINRNSGQPISIGSGCATLGIVAHEIGHALGFFHEQSRRDRNSHITVLFQNIGSNAEGNFRISPWERARGVPYDLSSNMHYGGFAFSRNAQPTIVTNDLALSGQIGQRSGLSHRDAQLANIMYRCAAGCSSPPTCLNGGYVSASCRCKCPPNASGSRCQTVRGSYYGTTCGNQAITQPGTITSRNYPALYPPGEHCVWIVTAPAGRRVRIRFDVARVIFRYRNFCYFDWIAVHLNGDSVPEQVRCGSELRGRSFTSSGNRLALEQRSYPRSYPQYQTGFSATVTFI